MLLRCTLDGLLLPAHGDSLRSQLRVYDGDESFLLEAVEARFYEIVLANRDERRWLERTRYRFLRYAWDFAPSDSTSSAGSLWLGSGR